MTIEEDRCLREGEDRDYCDEDDPLSLALKAQSERHQKNDAIPGSAAAVARTITQLKQKPRRSSTGTGNRREEWELAYQTKEKSFFNSPEARLEVDQEIIRNTHGKHRASSYPGIRITDENNSDKAFIYEREYRGRTLGDRAPVDSYYILRYVLGSWRVLE